MDRLGVGYGAAMTTPDPQLDLLPRSPASPRTIRVPRRGGLGGRAGRVRAATYCRARMGGPAARPARGDRSIPRCRSLQATERSSAVTSDRRWRSNARERDRAKLFDAWRQGTGDRGAAVRRHVHRGRGLGNEAAGPARRPPAAPLGTAVGDGSTSARTGAGCSSSPRPTRHRDAVRSAAAGVEPLAPMTGCSITSGCW